MKHILKLTGGRQISSGTAGAALRQVRLTQTANENQLLMPGAVSAALLEMTVFADPEENLLQEGQQMELFQVVDGVQQSLGIFFAEKVEWTGCHSCTVTAYDSVTLLDKDITDFINELTVHFSLGGLAQAVCRQCGLTLASRDFPNSEIRVTKPTNRRITGRQMMKWICQLSGCFCRAVGDRTVELAWYAPAAVKVGPKAWDGKVQITYADGHLTVRSGIITADKSGITVPKAVYSGGKLTLTIPEEKPRTYCFSGCFARSNAPVAAIGGVFLAYSYAAGGVTYPAGSENLLSIVGNPLLEGLDTESLTQMAQNLYNHLGTTAYTTCRLKVPSEAEISPGQILEFTDGVRWFTTLVMRTVRVGGALQIISTGEYFRNNPTAFNNLYEHLR